MITTLLLEAPDIGHLNDSQKLILETVYHLPAAAVLHLTRARARKGHADVVLRDAVITRRTRLVVLLQLGDGIPRSHRTMLCHLLPKGLQPPKAPIATLPLKLPLMTTPPLSPLLQDLKLPLRLDIFLVPVLARYLLTPSDDISPRSHPPETHEQGKDQSKDARHFLKALVIKKSTAAAHQPLARARLRTRAVVDASSAVLPTPIQRKIPVLDARLPPDR